MRILILFWLLAPTIVFGNCEEFFLQVTSPNLVIASHLTVDHEDNIIVAGRFNDTTNIDGHIMATDRENSIFLTKLDADGNVIWSTILKSGNATPQFWLQSLDVDGQGNILLTGLFREYVTFGEDTLTGNQDQNNFFLVKYDQNGEVSWGEKLTSPAGVTPAKLLLNSDHTLFFGVSYRDSLFFQNKVFIPKDSNNLILFHLLPSGSLLASEEILSANHPMGYAQLTYLNDDKIIVIGNLEVGHSLYLKDTTLIAPGSYGTRTFYILTLNRNGDFNGITFGFANSWGGRVSNILRGNDGYFYGRGAFSDSLFFGGDTLTIGNPGSMIESDIFLFKMDESVNILWLNNYGVKNSPTGLTDMTFDNFGNLLLKGNFRNNLHIGDSSYSSTFDDLYIIQFSPDGEFLDIFTSKSDFALGGMRGGGLAVNSRNEILASGTITGEAYLRDNYFKPTIHDGIIMKLCSLRLANVGIAELPAPRLDVYPNPVADILHIRAKAGLEIASLEVFNLHGQRMMHIAQPGKSVNVSALPAGVYLLHLDTGKGMVRKKFVRME